MGLFDLFRKSPSLAIADCLNRSVTLASSFPASLRGKSPNGATRPLCRVYKKGSRHFIEPLDKESMPLLDGIPISETLELDLDKTYSLALRGHLLALKLSRNGGGFGNDFKSGEWEIASKEKPESKKLIEKEAMNREDLEKRIEAEAANIAFPKGVNAHFPLSVVLPLIPERPPSSKKGSLHPRARYGRDAVESLSKDGVHTCPTCWKTFEEGSVMNIAAHDELTGDPILGPDAKLRFHAERFNDLGQALDGQGVVSIDLACPHCRGRLPTSFLSQNHVILSLVGAPSSGKSYYLATLLKLLPEELMRSFHCILQDGDPSGNVRLNEMKNRLFSALTPEDAFISKTDFEGLMYEQLPRNGKMVALPRPFVYHLRNMKDAENRKALVFYDNAGEHFKPTISLDESPGALHVAASSALFFLYDPTANRNFRRALRRKRDPQLRSQATDEQDTILAEMGNRVKKLQAKESHEFVDTPLAVMAGKFDVWKSLDAGCRILDPQERPLTLGEIMLNSMATRDILLQYCPTIVANAETVSSNVMYFPVSSLGHSPKEIEEGPMAGTLAPQPRRIRPILLTAPTLWALSQIAPELVGLPTD